MPAQKGIENTAWRPYWMLDQQQKNDLIFVLTISYF